MIHHPSTTRNMQKKMGENGTRGSKSVKMDDNLNMPYPKCIKSLKNPYYGRTYLQKRAETRVRVIADIQNFALCTHCVCTACIITVRSIHLSHSIAHTCISPVFALRPG